MSDSPVRTAIVEALNDLGEYDRLSYEQRTSWDEPYPPSFVSDRLETVRRVQWWLWLILGVAIAGAALVFVGVQLGWAGTDFASGLMMMGLPAAGIGIRWLVHNSKVEQLYALLHQLNDASETPSEDHSEAEASATRSVMEPGRDLSQA